MNYNRERVITELIGSCIAAGSKSALAKHIADGLQAIDDRRRKLAELWDRERAIREKFDADINGILQEMKMIQTGCNHLDTTYHTDPSGNNDSHTVCNICGAHV